MNFVLSVFGMFSVRRIKRRILYINPYKKGLLDANHTNVTIRREMGSDIDAACGQLRNKNK